MIHLLLLGRYVVNVVYHVDTSNGLVFVTCEILIFRCIYYLPYQLIFLTNQYLLICVLVTQVLHKCTQEKDNFFFFSYFVLETVASLRLSPVSRLPLQTYNFSMREWNLLHVVRQPIAQPPHRPCSQLSL